LRAILTNPLYNGWAVRNRRRPDVEKRPAPWRSAPPVDDELWARVVEVRTMRAKAAGRRRARHVHLLAKRMWCPCGRLVKADTSRQKDGTIARRYVHQDCDRWRHANVVAHRLDGPIEAQIAGIKLDAATLARIRAIAGRPAPVTTDLRRAQLEQELRAKAQAHAARRLTTEAYLAEHQRITTEIDSLVNVGPGAPVEDADRVIATLRALKQKWAIASREEGGRSAQAALVARIYRRITVEDGAIVSVELTEEAKRHGLMLALPETVVMARPARARGGQTTYRVRILDRDDWLRASRTA
jgi:hypothetical protein